MPLFMYRTPGAFYAGGPVEKPNEAEMRAQLRRMLGVRRLPRGLEVWTTSHEAQAMVRENQSAMQRGLPTWARGPL